MFISFESIRPTGDPMAQLVWRWSCQRWQTAGGGSNPCWSTRESQVRATERQRAPSTKKLRVSVQLFANANETGFATSWMVAEPAELSEYGRCRTVAQSLHEHKQQTSICTRTNGNAGQITTNQTDCCASRNKVKFFQSKPADPIWVWGLCWFSCRTAAHRGYSSFALQRPEGGFPSVSPWNLCANGNLGSMEANVMG